MRGHWPWSISIVCQADKQVCDVCTSWPGPKQVSDRIEHMVGVVAPQRRHYINAGAPRTIGAVRKCERTSGIGGAVYSVTARDQRRYFCVRCDLPKLGGHLKRTLLS